MFQKLLLYFSTGFRFGFRFGFHRNFLVWVWVLPKPKKWFRSFTAKNEPDVFQHRILENYAVLHLGNYAVLLSFDTQTIHVFCIVVFKIATIEN